MSNPEGNSPVTENMAMQLNTAIDAYLLERRAYLEKMYPDSVEILLEGERKTIQNSLEKGYLSDWQPGQDILVCITEGIKKSVTTESGAIDMVGKISERYSSALIEDIKEAQEKGLVISMDEAKTFSAKDIGGVWMSLRYLVWDKGAVIILS